MGWITEGSQILRNVKAPRWVPIVLVNACTGLNLVLGLAAVFAATMEHADFAAWMLLACVALDAADGFLARLWKVDSEFGAQLDSLADMTSFIIAGAVLTFYWFYTPGDPGLPLFWIGSAAALYVLGGAFRLARFNSGIKVEHEFQGMPTTAVAALVAIAYLTFPEMKSQYGLCWVVALSFLMVSVFPYPKWQKFAKLPPAFYLLVAIGGLVNFDVTVWTLAIAYIFSGPLRWLQRRLRPVVPVPVES